MDREVGPWASSGAGGRRPLPQTRGCQVPQLYHLPTPSSMASSHLPTTQPSSKAGACPYQARAHSQPTGAHTPSPQGLTLPAHRGSHTGAHTQGPTPPPTGAHTPRPQGLTPPAHMGSHPRPQGLTLSPAHRGSHSRPQGLTPPPTGAHTPSPQGLTAPPTGAHSPAHRGSQPRQRGRPGSLSRQVSSAPETCRASKVEVAGGCHFLSSCCLPSVVLKVLGTHCLTGVTATLESTW